MGRVAHTLALCDEHARLARGIAADLAAARLLRLKAAYAPGAPADIRAEPLSVEVAHTDAGPHLALRVADGLPARPEDAGPATARGLRVAECALCRRAVDACLRMANVRAQILHNVSLLQRIKDGLHATTVSSDASTNSEEPAESTDRGDEQTSLPKDTQNTGAGHRRTERADPSDQPAALAVSDKENVLDVNTCTAGDQDTAPRAPSEIPRPLDDTTLTDRPTGTEHATQTTHNAHTGRESQAFCSAASPADASDTSDDEFGVRALYAAEDQPPTVRQATSIDYASPGGSLSLRLSLVGEHSLWGHHLWNGARWMADWVCAHPAALEHLRVVELGAGAGLPSIAAATAGRAARVLATDYPDVALVANLRSNISRAGAQHTLAEPFLWGEGAFLARHGGAFDVALLCDVVFNHSEHARLLCSIEGLLSPTGYDGLTTGPPYAPISHAEVIDALKSGKKLAFCVFTHYRPWLAQKDMAFLRAAASSGLWEVRHVESKLLPDLLFPEDALDPRVADPDDLRTVHAYVLVRCGRQSADS